MELSTYLFFNGQCKEAFQFYEKVLKGKIEMTMTHGEAPQQENCPPQNPDHIMHVRLRAGDNVIMGSDAPGEHYKKPQGFSLSVTPKTKPEAERIFDVLSDNGTVIMPLGKTFWAEAFGMCVDRFGIHWMVNFQQ